MKHSSFFCFSFIFFLLSLSAQAAVRLPRLFSDGAVLQRGRPVNVWGWAEAGESVTVQLGRQQAVAVAAADGRWQVTLSAQKAGGPYTLTATAASGSATVQDVWLGDVWLCSGQSNIDVNLERVHPQYPQEIDQDATDRVRLLRVENEAALDGPRDDVRSSGWKTLSRDNAWHFSAVGYFLGKRMAQQTGVVQGVVQSSWGGTPIEAWLPIDTMQVIDPRGAAQSRLYADAELVRLANAANGRSAQQWRQLLEQMDPGVSGGWATATFDDSQWPQAEQHALPVPRWGFCGSYWVRQRIRVDAAHAGQPALLQVGTLVDADFTYLNGQQVGHTGYQYPPRRYRVPAGLLHEGENTLVVRFVNQGSSPSFVKDKPYRLEFADGHVIPLSPRWRVHEGAQMPQQPSMPTGTQNMAAATWNGMLQPLAPMTLAGVVWYQGESNTGRAELYERELNALMASWRLQFQQPELPFAIVQLAGFMEPSATPQESGWARLRESQRRAAMSDAHAGLVVATDLGEANDIHPLRKKEVAERAALIFDRLVFRQKRVLASPMPLQAAAVEGGRVVVTFDQPLREGSVHGFEVAGDDGVFRTVEATAQKATVTLQAVGRRVRYAWKHNPVEADCCGAANALPAASFELNVASK